MSRGEQVNFTWREKSPDVGTSMTLPLALEPRSTSTEPVVVWTSMALTDSC